MPSKPHSALGASISHRWFACPGSVNATRGIDSTDSVYAEEGTAAHELAAIVLEASGSVSAYDFIGSTFVDGFPVTGVMAESVQLYVDHCFRLIDACDFFRVEQVFDLAKLNPPAPMFGTADFIAYSKRRRELHVADFKYGKGVWVAAKGNPQLLYYALGAALLIDEPISKISMSVIQPRFAKGDPIRTATVDAVELAEWSFQLVARAHAALAPDAPTIAGEWCKFCPAKNSCLAHQNSKADAAYHQFNLADLHAAGA